MCCFDVMHRDAITQQLNLTVFVEVINTIAFPALNPITFDMHDIIHATPPY